MLAGVKNWLLALVAPGNGLDAQVRIEQLRAIAKNNIQSALPNAALSLLVAAIDLQWVSLAHISIWIGSVIASLLWVYHGSRRWLSQEHDIEDAGRFTWQMIRWTTPFMWLWSTMILYVWIPGNTLNNGFLITFLFASMAAGVPQTALCRHVAIAGMIIDIPLLATHSMTGTVVMDWLGPVLQTIAGLLICNLALTFGKTYRMIAMQRAEKDLLARDLANTAEQLAKARDMAQEASKAKSDFLANMSHELRTPLNAIIGFSDMIGAEALGPIMPKKYGDYVVDIHKSGMHLLNLINNLLDLAKIEAGKQDLVETNVLIGEAVETALRLIQTQARKAEIGLNTEIDETLSLFADEHGIAQMLTNLLSNAVKFTPPGGTVTAFAHTIGEGGLALGVKDTGIGMEPEEVSRALEPFVQVAHIATVEGWGSGLGVPLVKALIELHGGTFHIESHKGVGTCAWGEFPAHRTRKLPEARRQA